MDEKTKDLLKEAYNYGYAHAIEDVEEILSTLKGKYTEEHDVLVSELRDVLKEFAKDLKSGN